MVTTAAGIGTSGSSGKVHSVKDLVVPVDARIERAMADAFPIRGVRSDTADNNTHLRRTVALSISRAMRDKDCLFHVNCKIVGAMTNSRQRTSLFRFFNNDELFRVAVGYVPSRNCKGRTFSKIPVHSLEVYQHNGTGCREVSAPSLSYLPCWGFSDATVPVLLPGTWRSSFHQSFMSACEGLWEGSTLFETLISKSLNCLLIDDASDAVLSDAAAQREESSPKRGKGKLKLSETQLKQLYRERWSVFREDPTDDITRAHGRVYYELTNQPKYLRRRLLRFRTNGPPAPMVELDMSSTYPVCLAAKCLASRYGMTASTGRLISDVTNGDFYPRIKKAAGPKLAHLSYEQTKKRFSIDCLFDVPERFGKAPIFHAFCKVYPDAGRLIMAIRKKPYGARQLSNMLNEIEGGFFIDTVLPALHELGIECLPIHDAVMVSKHNEALALRCIKDLSVSYFGFLPNFKSSSPC